jgi:hypothetical protein
MTTWLAGELRSWFDKSAAFVIGQTEASIPSARMLLAALSAVTPNPM